MGIEALLSTQIIDTTAVGRAVMTAADAAAARTAIDAAATSHTHAASDITSGIIGTARLATGTASASTYLRGDQTWQAIAAGGISSLNALTDATQTFAVGTSGTNFAISSASGVHTFNLPDASATARGVVSTGSQTFAGDKTFSGQIKFSSSGQPWAPNIQNPAYGSGTGIMFSSIGTAFISNNTYAWYIENGAGHLYGLSGAVIAWNNDLFILRDAADTFAQRRGTNAQTFRLYNTFTSTTSFERLNIAWAANICTIGTEAGSGGGTLRGLRIGDATTSLVGLWGATPIAQPTTAVAAATRVGGGGTALTDTDTFDGYTLAQIVKALRNIGALA